MPQPDTPPRLVQREVVLLVVLALVAAVAFVFTREVAQRQHAATLDDAAEWFAIGEGHLSQGRPAEAVDALRQASNRDRSNQRYTLTLARALAAKGQLDEARAALLALRDQVPDDPDVNIALARLAATREDLAEAQRFYQNALYGVWAPGREEERQRLRVELIGLLLEHDERGRALSEVVALTTNLGDVAPARIEAGQLLLAAGDPEQALDQFVRALRLAPGDNDALAGAGEAAFVRGDYVAARRYFSRAKALPERLTGLAAVAAVAIDGDPLATRLTMTTRRARLLAALGRTSARLEECAAMRPGAAASLDPQRAEVANMASSIDARALRDRPELVDEGVDVVYRAQLAAADACGAPGHPEDRALLLIGERYAGPA